MTEDLPSRAGAPAGRDMVGALGAEVDRLETEIQQLMPGIRHIDLVCFPCGPHTPHPGAFPAALATGLPRKILPVSRSPSACECHAWTYVLALAPNVHGLGVGHKFPISTAGFCYQRFWTVPLGVASMVTCSGAHVWCSLQETDRGRHDKNSAQRRGFYSIPIESNGVPPGGVLAS